jgi:hypothetical protein
MIEIDILLGSESVSPWREEMICVSGALVNRSQICSCKSQNSPRDHDMDY